MPRNLLLPALLAGWLLFTPTSQFTADGRASDEPPRREGSVDDELLKELDDALDDELLEGLDDGFADEEPLDGDSLDGDSLDEELLEGLEDGEDVGEEPKDPLLRVGRRMRTVEQRIAGLNSDDKTQNLQEQIVDELAKLIKQVRKQSQSGQSARKDQQRSERQKVQQPNGASSQGSQTASSQPAADSTDRLGSADGKKADLNKLKDLLLKNVWGHLPETLRDQMLQNASEQFLPKYELQIEEYFRRLVELKTVDR